ncbi:hypothetical protein G6F24_018890 [Rhizopus arrhizus]|nr:hypothetical protein G6F24_018890 [Rhizopus arrhizus]
MARWRRRKPTVCHQGSSHRVTVLGEPVPKWARIRSTVGRSPAAMMSSAAWCTSSSLMPLAIGCPSAER